MTRARMLVLAALAAPLAGCARDEGHVVHVIAEHAPGLKTNARVQYLGADVGRVQQVWFTTGGVRIDLAIDRDVPIRQRDTVRIAPTTAFGPQLVAIVPGDTGAPLMPGLVEPHAHAQSILAQPSRSWTRIARRLGLARADTATADGLTAQPASAPR